MNYSGPFFPLYTQPNQFGIPYENFEAVMSSSSPSVSGTSPNVNGGMPAAAMLPHYHQYAMPVPFHYFLGNQYPQMYAPTVAGDCGRGREEMMPKLVAAQPVSVKVLSSSDQVNATGASILTSECHDNSQKSRDAKSGKHDYPYAGYSVASLSSPLKRMKVIDDPAAMERSADESMSAYFADVSANSTGSDDDDAEENAEVSSIMSLLLKPEQRQQHDTALPLAELGHITTKEKENLEQITGASDLSALLSSGLEAMKARGGEMVVARNSNAQSPPPDICSEIPQDKYIFTDECAGITPVDMHDIDAKVTTSQEDSYFLPSLDSLLNLGEDTIVTMKAAMSLDIQGVVEIATEEVQGQNASLPSANTDEIIN